MKNEAIRMEAEYLEDLGEPLRGALPRSRRAIRSITFAGAHCRTMVRLGAPRPLGGSAAIPLAQTH